ncbi:MAG TPA: cupin domain-containing protein [Rhodanobacteraceae bacterium]|nr:cupin domain-containing protein [Rhodanobacteraceae bacterium]
MSTPSFVVAPAMLEAVRVDEVQPVVIGPGCHRRDLPSASGVRVWVVDMSPGSTWPAVDEHPGGEYVQVITGELIEGEQRFGPGTYLFFKPGSSHRPRTERGVRLFGFNPVGSIQSELPLDSSNG